MAMYGYVGLCRAIYGYVCLFIIWPCLKRTGNKQIQEFDWLKSILTAV